MKGSAMLLALMLYGGLCSGAEDYAPDREVVYKTIGEVELKLHVFEPAGHQASDQRPAIVFFFGGGWNGGTPQQFYEQSRALADRGMVAMSAEYRVKSRNGTSPFECVKDGKSAIRWVRQHAVGVDPNRIVASGGSAGGHVAACSGVIQGCEEQGEDLSVSSVPNAMILFNPVLDTTARGLGLRQVGEDRQTEISPCHHVKADIVPTIVFHGTADTTVPFENAERFTRLMKEADNVCQLGAFEGQKHGFFNGIIFRPKSTDLSGYEQTMEKSIIFLKDLGYLDSAVSSRVATPVKVRESAFCKSLVPQSYILRADEGNWNWGMAPIHDEEGRLHVFNSIIPKKGRWNHDSKIGHYTADQPEGPYTFEGIVFQGDQSTYHNPQISRVDDTYVMVFLMNASGTRLQQVGIATAKSLDGPWTQSPHNPVVRASGTMGGANINHASNPTFVATPEGQYRIYFKSMTDKYPRRGAREISLAVSDEIEGPYENYAGNPLISYADQGIDIEDPYAFYYKGMYWMLVEDRRGVKDLLEGNPQPARQIRSGGFRPGLLYTSKDGIDWGVPELGYQTNETYFGAELARSERPSILWKDGKPAFLFLACHDDDPTAGYFLKIDGWEADTK